MKKNTNFFIIVCFLGSLYSQQYSTDISIAFHGVSGYMEVEGSDSTRLAMNITVGEPIIGTTEKDCPNPESICSMDLGFWSFYRLPPSAPIVYASDGDDDYPSAILIYYTQDILSPPITHTPPFNDNNGNGVYDYGEEAGVYTGNIEAGKWQVRRDEESFHTYQIESTQPYHLDELAQDGAYHSYGVIGLNSYGESVEGFDIGFSNEFGKVHGRVQIPGSPPAGDPIDVQDVEISIIPDNPDHAGNALSFSDISTTSAKVFNNYSTVFSDEITIEFWFKESETGQNLEQQLLEVGSSVNITKNNEKYQFSIETNTNVANINIWRENFEDWNINTLQWNHYSLTYDGSEVKIYINGVRKKASTTYSLEGDLLSLGYLNVGTKLYSDLDLDGYIDDIRLWNQARIQDDLDDFGSDGIDGTNDEDGTEGNGRYDDGEVYTDSNGNEEYDGEILGKMNEALGGERYQDEGLKGYWRCDEGINNICFDQSANVNHLYLFSDNDLFWSTTEFAPTVLKAFTGEDGTYSISGIWFDTGADFTRYYVIPYKKNHHLIVPKQNGHTVNHDEYGQVMKVDFPKTIPPFNIHTNMDFWDNSTFKVTGTILYDDYHQLGHECYVDGIEIKICEDKNEEGLFDCWDNDGILDLNKFHSFPDPVITGQCEEDCPTGKYTIILEPEKSGIILPVASSEHTFKRDFESPWGGDYFTLHRINSDFAGINFIDEIYSTFSGQVVGGTCEYPIEGQPHIELFSDCGFNLTDDNGKAISVDEDGNFALGYLPPINFTMLPGNVGFPSSDAYLGFNYNKEISFDGNGIYNPPYTDENGNYVPGEEFTDCNDDASICEGDEDWDSGTMGNGIYGNGFWDEGELFTDCNDDLDICEGDEDWNSETMGNDVYDDGEPYTELGEPFIDSDSDDRVVNMVYRSDIDIEYSNLPAMLDCKGQGIFGHSDSLYTPVVMKEGETSTFNFKIYESYGEEQCVLNKYNVTIGGDLITDEDQDILIDEEMITDQSGLVVVEVNPAGPRTTGGGSHPYQRMLELTIDDPIARPDTTFKLYVFVEGEDPVNQLPAINTSESPIFVLRDPPGDFSYSSYSASQSYCHNVSVGETEENGETLSSKIMNGFKFSTGVSIGSPFVKASFSEPNHIINDFSDDLTVTQTMIDRNTSEFCWEISTDYKTSQSEGLIGKDATLYVGAGYTMTFGQNHKYSVNPATCDEDIEITLSGGISDLNTHYMHTEFHIKNILIPTLQYLVDNSDNVTCPDDDPIPDPMNDLTCVNAETGEIDESGSCYGSEYLTSCGNDGVCIHECINPIEIQHSLDQWQKNITDNEAAIESASPGMTWAGDYDMNSFYECTFPNQTAMIEALTAYYEDWDTEDINQLFTFPEFSNEENCIDQCKIQDNELWNSEILGQCDVLNLSDFSEELLDEIEPNIDSNLSFDGGLTYDYLYSISNTFSSTQTILLDIEYEDSENWGSDYAGVGKSTIDLNFSNTTDEQSETETNNNVATIGFHLEDDDIIDYYNFQVKEDPTWGMPVFVLNGGASSCPFEPETVPYDGVELTSDRYNIVDIMPGEVGTFNLTVGNIANIGCGCGNEENGVDARRYHLRRADYDNQGVVIKNNNGSPLTTGDDNSNAIWVEPGESETLFFTIERNLEHNVYNFDDIKIWSYPPCEYELYQNYSPSAFAHEDLLSEINLNVSFIAPCSEVSIYELADDWVINQSNNNFLDVTITGYDLTDTELQKLHLDYYNHNLDIWMNSANEVEKSELTGEAHIFEWDVSSLPDGAYKLRARSECTFVGDGIDGYSAEYSGIIDRLQPLLMSTEPADDVYEVNDEIAIEFDQLIDCDSVHVGTATLVNITEDSLEVDDYTSCYENKITIEPLTSNYLIENDYLGVSVTGIKDLNGNEISSNYSWEFEVNLNPIEWNQPSYNEVFYLGEDNFFTVPLRNNGNSQMCFNFGEGGNDIDPGIDLPDYLTPDPMSECLNSGGDIDITINIDEDIPFGPYQGSLIAETEEGNEELAIDLDILCRPPDWTFNPAEYQFSMTMISKLIVEGDPSIDEFDRVAAIIDGEIRGYSDIVYYSEYDAYLAYLTIYNNSNNDQVSFRAWDSDSCRELWEIEQTVLFLSGDNQGSGEFPFDLNANGAFAQHIDINPGWTWTSLNISNDDMSLGTVTNYLSPSSGDRIISPNTSKFGQYSNDFGWIGTINEFDNQSMYQTHFTGEDVLTYIGFEVDPSDNQIPYNQGWSWIAYTPQLRLDINDALISLDASYNDQFKSQFDGFVFYNGLEWVGSLDYLYPNQGYMLNSLNSGSFNYPTNGDIALRVRSNMAQDENILDRNYSIISPEPALYEHSMSVLGSFSDDHMYEFDLYNSLLVASFNDEIRGIIDIELYDELGFAAFLTVYSNDLGESIELSIYNPDKDEFIPLNNEEILFEANSIMGNLSSPVSLVPFDPIPDSYLLSEAYPNPFNPSTMISYNLPEDVFVSIKVYNLLGHEIIHLVNENQSAGYKKIMWNGLDENGMTLSTGIYLLVMDAGQFYGKQKLLLLK